MVEVTDGVYLKTLQVQVTVNAQADDGELLTLMMPGYGHSTLYANAEMDQPITVWGRIRRRAGTLYLQPGLWGRHYHQWNGDRSGLYRGGSQLLDLGTEDGHPRSGGCQRAGE